MINTECSVLSRAARDGVSTVAAAAADEDDKRRLLLLPVVVAVGAG